LFVWRRPVDVFGKMAYLFVNLGHPAYKNTYSDGFSGKVHPSDWRGTS